MARPARLLLTLAAAALLLLTLASAAQAQNAQSQRNWKCRMAPNAAHSGCGLPYELSNFQNQKDLACDPSVKIGRPSSLQDLQALVTMFPHVKAVGTGDSWWKEQFCAGNSSDSIDIVTTEQTPTLNQILQPVDPSYWVNRTIPKDFPIQVNEDDETVTVAAGVPQRILLDYLAEYKYWKQRAGWSLQAFSWFIDQTIGGAVSTGTHGSSMKYGSLSSQVRSLKLVLANGTLLEISPNSNPHLFRAAIVSVGRLGIITELTLKIRRQQSVTKKLQEPSFSEFAKQIKTTQDAFVAAKQAGNVDGIRNALFQVDETQTFWWLPNQQVWRTDYDYSDKEPLGVLLNIDSSSLDSQPMVSAMSGPADSVYSQQSKAQVPANPNLPYNTRFWTNFYSTAGRSYVTPGVFETRKAYMSMTEQGASMFTTTAPYDQFEVSIPMEIAGDCLLEVGNVIYGKDQLWDGFRTPALIRFVTGEDAYLSNTNGGPRMWINLEDYITRSNNGKRNDKFYAVIQLFRDRCQARLHWGKYGWNTFAKCFDGAKEYPDTWCDFGCAVQELDPGSKFAGQSNIWQWYASRGGQAVPFASCCSSAGFNKAQCQCAPRADGCKA